MTARLQPTMPSYRPEAVTKLLIEKALQGELDVFGNARDTWLSVFREAELPLEQVLLLLQARQSWARDIAHARLAALPPAEGLPSSIPQELLDDARWQAARDLRPFEGWRSRRAKTRLAIARWPAAVADAALRSLYEHDLEVLQTDAGTASSPLRMQGIATAWSPSSVAPWELMRALPDGQERIRSLVRALTRAALTPSGELSPQGAMLVKSALRPLFARRGQTPLPIAESLALLDVVPPSLQAEVWSLGYSTPEGKRGPLKSLEWLLRAPPVARQLLGLHRPFIGTYLEPDQLLEATRFLLSQAGFPEEVVIETLAFAEATRLVEAFPEVRALASGPPSEVRTKAFDTLKALVELRTVQKAAAATELRDEVFEKAQRLAKSEDPARRRAAAGLFARMGDDRSLLELALLSDDEDPAVRWAVAIALSPGTEKR